MKIRTIGRHMKESFKSIARNGWMTFASVSAVTVTLLLVGVFYVILMNLNEVATSIEEDVQIKVLIDTTADEETQKALQTNIKAIKEVGSIQYSSKEDELTELASSFGEEGSIIVDSLGESNPLNDALIVKTKNPHDTTLVAEKIEKMDFVYQVNYGKNQVEKLFNILKIGRNVGVILIVGLLFTAIFLISNTIKITIIARSKEIEIMRLVGATNGFIRWPFFLEGVWLGVLGSIVPIAIIITLYKNIYDVVAEKLHGSFIHILDLNPFAYQVSGILLLMGCLIGVWGSLMSVRKFLKV